MALVITTAATSPPVSLSEAKEQCRIVTSDVTHDSLLTRLINDATAKIERITLCKMAQQTVRLELDSFPTGVGLDACIDLTTYPVNSITSIVYDDVDNVEQTLVEGTDYYVSLSGMYPTVSPVTYWPSTKTDKPAAVRITMSVGFDGSPNTTAAPEDLRHAILLHVKHSFDHGGKIAMGREVHVVNSIEDHVAMHRRYPV